MAGYTNITLIGNVGRDSELRYTASGMAVANFNLAVNRTWNQGDEKKEEVTWYKVTMWGKTAEGLSQYITKGKQLLVVSDRIEASAYLDKQGKPAANLEVTAREIKFLGGGNGSGYQPSDEDYPGTDTRVSEDIPF